MRDIVSPPLFFQKPKVSTKKKWVTKAMMKLEMAKVTTTMTKMTATSFLHGKALLKELHCTALDSSMKKHPSY